MRVLYLLSSSSTFGGSTKSFLRMCMEMRKKEIEMHVICPDGGPAYQILMQEGFQTFIIPTRFHTYPRWNSIRNCLLFLPRLIKHYIVNHRAFRIICALCEQYHYSVIHTNVSVVDVGEKAARKYGIQHIFHIREYQDLDFGMNMMPSNTKYVKYLQRSMSICITRSIQQHFGLNDDNSVVIYNGIKSDKDICYNAQKDNYFLFVGRVDPNKGFESVLRAYAEAYKNNPSVKLYVAGMFISPVFEKQVKELISQKHLTDDVVFLGLRSDIDLLMQKAKACIIASPNEAFGLVMVEAMFNGCLTIAFDSCGTHEQLENAACMGLPNITLAYANETELVDLIQEVGINDISIYMDIIERSQKVVSALYSIEQNASRVYSYYEKLLQSE